MGEDLGGGGGEDRAEGGAHRGDGGHAKCLLEMGGRLKGERERERERGGGEEEGKLENGGTR